MELDIDYEVIKSRHSVRQYLDKPLPTKLVEELNKYVDTCNLESGLHMQLVTNEPNAYARSFWANYGKFSGVANYICLVGNKDSDEMLGYYGEILTLKAQQLGLNTCWCGLCFSKKNARFTLDNGERLRGLIALGYGTTQGVKSKDKRPEQICRGVALAPNWFRKGVECALLAPSALNQQRFRFEYVAGTQVRVTTALTPYGTMDLGIAKLHFELGARPVRVEWV